MNRKHFLEKCFFSPENRVKRRIFDEIWYNIVSTKEWCDR